MKSIARRMIIPFMLALSACGPQIETVHDFTPPLTESGRVCAAQCQMTQQACHHSCTYHEDRCREEAHRDARRDYEDYYRERKGQDIKRDVDSFDKSYQCSNSACGEECDGGFRQCYQMCGGRVADHQICTGNCDQLQQAAPPLAQPPAPPAFGPAPMQKLGAPAGAYYPPGLGEHGREAFRKYSEAPTHKAFAMASDGSFGWRSGQRTIADAMAGALENCGQATGSSLPCKIISTDDSAQN